MEKSKHIFVFQLTSHQCSLTLVLQSEHLAAAAAAAAGNMFDEMKPQSQCGIKSKQRAQEAEKLTISLIFTFIIVLTIKSKAKQMYMQNYCTLHSGLPSCIVMDTV